MKNTKLANTSFFKNYSLSTFYCAECQENRGILSFQPAKAHREGKYKGGAMKGWVRSEQRFYKDYGQRRFVEKDES